MKRIKSIDGWRTIAAAGSLWTHTWAITQFQSLKIGSIDLFKAINVVGNGVHFFFVISGFCMYMVLHKANEVISWPSFFAFVKKRFIRIAPAFYFACIVMGVVNLYQHGENLWMRLFANFLFIQNYVPDTIISAPFWSLAVEWYFYLLLPVMFYLFYKIGFAKTFWAFFSVWLGVNVLHYLGVIKDNGWWYHLPENFVHFLWGILLSYIITYDIKLHGFLKSSFSIIPAILLMNLGKTLFSQYALNFAGKFQWVVLSIGPSLMTLGFCWLVYISLKNEWFSKVIGNRLMAYCGKFSYSFYLWHSFVLSFVYKWIKDYLHFGGYNTVIVFIATAAALIPISYLSYILFERFYFKLSSQHVLLAEDKVAVIKSPQ